MSIRDILLGLLVIFAWAANTVVIKFITLEVEPFTGLALRFIVTCAFFAPFFRWTGRKQFWLMVQVTILMGLFHWAALIWSIDKLEVSMAAILLQTQVIFTVLLGVFIFGEKVGWRTISGIAIGILGVIVLVGLPQNPPSMIGVAGLIFSMLAVALAYARQKGIGPITATNYIAHLHVIGIIPILIVAFMLERPLDTNWDEINYNILAPALLFQAFIVSLSHMLWQRLIARNQMSILPNLTLLLPIIGVALAILLLDETLTPSMLIGGTITTAGVAIVMIRKKARIEA